jgi:BlaI family penicillinase repressor
MPAPFQPTDAELAVLRVLWDREPCTVREIHDAFAADGRQVASTPRPKAQKALVDDLVERAFGGAAAELVLHALAGRKATPAELGEIRRLLDRMEAKSP